MALKATVHEYCQRCGQLNAEERDGFVYTNLHDCPKAPPGPKDWPIPHRLSEIIFLKGKDQ